MSEITQPEQRRIVDESGREREQIKCSCSLCHTCWLYIDINVCQCGGPYSHYLMLDTKQKLEAKK